MKVTTELNGIRKVYSVPSIPQIGDYTYKKSLTCDCQELNDYMTQLSNWHCDGVYDSHIGMLICFTCKKCGERFCFHLRDNAENYAFLGVFDEYEEKEG